MSLRNSHATVQNYFAGHLLQKECRARGIRERQGQVPVSICVDWKLGGAAAERGKTGKQGRQNKWTNLTETYGQIRPLRLNLTIAVRGGHGDSLLLDPVLLGQALSRPLPLAKRVSAYTSGGQPLSSGKPQRTCLIAACPWRGNTPGTTARRAPRGGRRAATGAGERGWPGRRP